VTDDVPCSDTTYHTVYIDSIPALELIIDRDEVCNGERINMGLNYLYTANGFSWEFGDDTGLEDGSGVTYHSYNQPGTYYIKVSSHHPKCDDATAFDTVLVKPYPVVNLGPDTSICAHGVPVGLSSKSFLTDPDEIKWLWSTGSTNPIIRVIEPGIYTLTADWNGCKTSDEIVVKKDCYTDIPNSFTPNGDGNNDYFYPRQLISRGVIQFSMVIYNRWGQKVFETNSIDGRGWDGKLNGKDQPSGVYVYQMSVSFKDNTSEQYTGNVTLIR
jgi:gliding motility-associated-like protein